MYRSLTALPPRQAGCAGTLRATCVGAGLGAGAATGGLGAVTTRGAGLGAARTTGLGAGRGAATTGAGAVAVRAGAGAGAGAGVSIVICSGASAAGCAGRAAAIAVCDSDGVCPQIWLRCRFTRGTQVVFPSIPARMNTQPLLSTYCVPLKDAGGNSAGNGFDWACNDPAETPVIVAIRATILVTFIISPTRYGCNDASSPRPSKALIPSISCQTCDLRRPRGPERCSPPR